MNVFLTSIMHSETASDFSVVEKNFELMARSICSQTNQNFVLVVVCNNIPKINFTHKNIDYHIVDFPPAIRSTDTTPRRLDKATKIVSGLLYIKKYNPEYVFVTDADDWISIHLNEYILSQPQCVGFYINSGYVIDIGSQKCMTKFGLHRFSGSTFASNYLLLMENLNLNENLNENSTFDAVIHFVPLEILLDLLDSHNYMYFFREKGLEYKRVPFKALAWVRNTGDNILSDDSVINGVSLSKGVLTEFGLEEVISIEPHSDTVLERFKHYISSIISFIGSVVVKR